MASHSVHSSRNRDFSQAQQHEFPLIKLIRSLLLLCAQTANKHSPLLPNGTQTAPFPTKPQGWQVDNIGCPPSWRAYKLILTESGIDLPSLLCTLPVPPSVAIQNASPIPMACLTPVPPTQERNEWGESVAVSLHLAARLRGWQNGLMGVQRQRRWETAPWKVGGLSHGMGYVP